MAIVPDAQGGQHEPFLPLFDRPASPTAIRLPRAREHGQLQPQPIHHPNGWGGLQPGHFAGVRPLLKSPHPAVTGFSRYDLAHTLVHGFLEIAQTVPQTVVQKLVIQKGAPAALRARNRLPTELGVPPERIRRASVRASRRVVVPRSPAFLGMKEGATTQQSWPVVVRER
jgi:hypothetical protein